MRLDATLTRILTEIQSELQTEKNITLSIEHIHNMVDIQIEATKVGFTKSLTVHWIRWGKFVFTNSNNAKKDIKVLTERLEDSTLLPHEQIEVRKNAIIQKAAEKNQRIASSDMRYNQASTLEEVLEKPIVNTIKTTVFKSLNNKHFKKSE